jgi:hypothetical protein
MGEPVLQLNNAANWELLYSELRFADQVSSNSYRPIPAFTIPILIESPWIAVGSNSQSARFHWWLGCRIQPIVVVPESPFGSIAGMPVPVPLNEITLYKFPSLQAQFRLRVQIPWWHRELGFTLYQYTGPVGDTTEDLITERTDVIRVDLARIEFKLDNLPPAA